MGDDPRKPVVAVKSLLLAVALTVAATATLVGPLLQPSRAYTPHALIFINGNANFTAANGVTGGTGAPSDPYVISGWEIDTAGGVGIEVRNADAHFAIRNLYVHTTFASFDGIIFNNVTNGRVENSEISGNWAGVVVSSSANVTLTGNNVTWNYGDGVRVSGTSNATLTGNLLTRNGGDGVVLSSAANATLSGNTFVVDGLYLSGSVREDFATHAITADNTVNGKPLRYYRDCSGLDLDGAPVGQLLVANCTAVRVANVDVRDTDLGILLAFVDGASVSGSTMVNVTTGAVLRSTLNATLSDNTVLGSNATAIQALASTNVSLQESVVASSYFGIRMSSSTQDFLIARNQVSGSVWDGLRIEFSSDGMVQDNSLSGNWNGLYAWYSTNLTISGNTVTGNEYGLSLSNGNAGIRVAGNGFVGNTVQASDSAGGENAWNDSYPRGGNYWSDYGGADNCSGPGQDICPGPDGIGDTPRLIDGNSVDFYPRMRPPGPQPPRVITSILSGTGLENVTLQWNASGDEGQPGGTIAYEVLRAEALAGPFVRLALVAASGSSTYEYVCVGCGHALTGPDTYFLRVRALDAANRSADSNLAARQAMPISPGRNLLSVPLRQADESAARTLQTVQYTHVRTYRGNDVLDPWKARYASRPGDLAELQYGEAFWVNASAPGRFTVAGLVDENPTFLLTPGWNLVGYASFVREPWEASFAGVPGVVRIEAFDASATDPYRLRTVAAGELLVTGAAYWVLLQGGGGPWVQG